MKRVTRLLSVFALLMQGCGEREEEEVDIDRIVQLLNEEEPREWSAPQEEKLISGVLRSDEENSGERLK